MAVWQWLRTRKRWVIWCVLLTLSLGLTLWTGLFWTARTTPAIAAEADLLTIYQPLQTMQWEGPYTSRQGVAYYGLSEYTGSAGAIESDLEAARAMRDPRREAEILAKLALDFYLTNDFDKAIAAYKQGLALAQANRLDLEGLFLASLGLVYAQQGFYIEALEKLNDYWVIVGTRGDRREEERVLGNLGNVYFSSDLYLKAIECHQKRLALARQLSDRAGEGKALGDLGVVYQALGDLPKAIDLHQQHLAIARQAQDTSGQKMALANLGMAYHAQGDYDQAITYQQQRLTLAQQTQDLKATAEAQANLAGAEYFLGRYDRAIALYDQAWQLTWDKLNNADILYGLRGNQGLAYFQKGDTAKALELYQQYFTFVSSRNNRRGEGIAKNNAAAIRFRQGNLPSAETALREAIAAWEDLRSRLGNNDAYKVSIFETQQAPYINLQRVLRLQNKADAALEIAERGRAKAFAELLARRRNPKTPAHKPSGPPPTLAQIQRIAKTANATLVEYSLIAKPTKTQGKLQSQESELLIWVVQPSGQVIGRSLNLSALDQPNFNLTGLVTRSRNFIGITSRGVGTSASNDTRQTTFKGMAQLHRLLIQPIADLLPKDPKAPVIFVPQGSLFLVPFAALQDSDRAFLVEQHTVLVIPSIQVLGLIEPAQAQPLKTLTPAVIVGNPTMPEITLAAGQPPETLPSLPGAEEEAKEIARLLSTQALTGDAATKATVVQKMQSAQLVHLATHGLLDDFTGLGVPGAIALAPDTRPNPQPDDGLLTASELLDLRVPAKLVVLSACDTGRGKITGDGVIGLSRSLLIAGVPSIVVSLWAVPDAPTAALMTQFYEELQHGNSKVQALRQAMLSTLQKYPNPRDWAAFTLMGLAT